MWDNVILHGGGLKKKWVSNQESIPQAKMGGLTEM